MKQWRVDAYCIGPAVDADSDNTNSLLADILNTYEHQGATVKAVLLESPGNYKIVYTIENDNRVYGI